MAQVSRTRLAMLSILDLIGRALGLDAGRQELKIVYRDGRAVEARVLPQETKLTREQLDLVVLEPET
jgi:hypothetical protein